MKSCKPHTSPPKQDPAAYVAPVGLGTPTLGLYQPRAQLPSCAVAPLLPRSSYQD